MREFIGDDLHGAAFRQTDLRGVRIHNCDLSGARLTGVVVAGADIDGDIRGLRVQGVEVAPLVEAELDRRYPDRAAMRPTDADGFRAGWAVVERLWESTVARARGLDPALLHESVAGEWSFIETLRHLVAATDSWVRRAVQGEPRPWHPLSLPCDDMHTDLGLPWDRTARPSLDEVLAIRADRMAGVRALMADLTDERLDEHTTPVEAPGWPPPASHLVRKCLLCVLNEEWEHRLFAERDLAVLETR